MTVNFIFQYRVESTMLEKSSEHNSLTQNIDTDAHSVTL